MPKKHTGARGAYSAPNCGPTAVAYITGRTVRQIMTEMRRVFDLPRNWRGYCDVYALEIMLNRHGVRHSRYHSTRRRVSLAKWIETARRHNRRYLIRTGNHFAVLYHNDGWRVVDQQGNRTLASLHHYQRCMVTGLIELY